MEENKILLETQALTKYFKTKRGNLHAVDEVDLTLPAGEIVEYGTLYDVFDAEKHHPYTDGLFGAIPDLTRETERLDAIDGLMPNPTMLPEGCSFAPRCKKCMEICKTRKPSYYRNGEHIIKCFLHCDNAEKEGE